MLHSVINIRIIFFCITFHFMLVSGSSLSERVHQTPGDIHSQPGHTAVFNCSHSIKDYDNILWYRQTKNKQMEFLGYMNVKLGFPEAGVKVKINGNAEKEQTCTLTVESLNLSSSAVYFCPERCANYEAYFGPGTKVTVLGKKGNVTTPAVQVLGPSKKECRSDWDLQKKKTLTCVASDFYPDHVSVSWQLNGVSITVGVATDSDATKSKTSRFYRISSRLQVSAEDWYDPNNLFNCTVSFYDGKETSYHHANITGEEDVHLTRKEYLTVTGNAKLSYTVLIVKSCVYGAFVWFLVRRLQSSPGK
ncbi:M1-specific T cell receptor beta chain-like [Cololabis saira]|uniref:M1-specific T cell receptor beta chain-like n=1 Tax=Cololabis saira TaxID=129043 RepID=UPI002AD56B6A|nr:M1-specific T cell receptor beta chain-like [Cololabis saira]